ncbi:phage tail protein [Sphingomonas sp. S1-29]|uniref:phage tail protein n=1 Tax=Sphingomonas sp. S1-29 TaxID=2991074 RepID=UPI002240B0FF|nr:phage tail protein [Sphingomonas sp. S1-29]UZK70318.1 phage tail protein [Sphingomonas sp. S1-29]
MPAVIRPNPYPSYNFLVTVNAISNNGLAAAGSFTEVSGLEIEVAPIEYRTGSEGTTTRKSAGLRKYTNLTLKRGITGDLVFWNWILAGIQGTIQRADGSIVMLDENRTEVMRYNFVRGWPCKYTGPGLNAANNEIAMETLEICHEGLEIDV